MREVDRSIFNDIVSGKKTIETRAATKKYRDIQAGDTLSFKCGEDTFIKNILASTHYDSLEAMFADIPLDKVLPQATTIDEAKKIYYSFPRYEEKIAAHGIMAFTLR